jgi:hypothetical protein
MAWWKARRKAAPGRQADDETPDPRVWPAAEADSLYQQAIQLAREPGGGDEAERVSAAAVAAYRQLSLRGEIPPSQAKRKLALWRHSMLLGRRGRPREAMEPGREGVVLERELLATAGPHDPATDELVGETATAINDLSQAAAAAGLDQEHRALIREAVALCRQHPGPRARQALGTALHNQAAVAAAAVAAAMARGQLPSAAVPDALDAAAQAVAVRREVLDLAQPVSCWELANSLLQRGKLQCLCAMGSQERPTCWRPGASPSPCVARAPSSCTTS